MAADHRSVHALRRRASPAARGRRHGDETTIEFDASSATSLPKGWKRDFLLYTDGWIKDSDLNTAFGTTVEPLPFHKIKAYPYERGDMYPADSAHQKYLREYDTRAIGRR